MLKSRGLILDRDGVINVERGYVGRQSDFAFVPGLFPFLRAARNRCYRLVIVTNQSGVARGLYTEADYEKLTAWMLDELRREGIGIDLILACFEYKDAAIEKYRRESFWRKPNPGMIMEAAQRLRLDLKTSVMLGDQERDMQAAEAAGIGTRLMLAPGGAAAGAGFSTVKDFAEALKALA